MRAKHFARLFQRARDHCGCARLIKHAAVIMRLQSPHGIARNRKTSAAREIIHQPLDRGAIFAMRKEQCALEIGGNFDIHGGRN